MALRIAVALAVAACSAGGGESPPVDAPPPIVDAPGGSLCGDPGDPGNEMGVGKYCTQIEDCAGKAASICAVLGDPRATFCTKTCAAGQGAEACGSEASCQCQGGLCGCLPNRCL